MSAVTSKPVQSDDLTAQLDAMISESRRLEQERLDKSLAEYRAVVKGLTKAKPDDVLKLLDRVGLTVEDFKSDKAAWIAYQTTAAEHVPEATLQAQISKVSESHGAWEKFEKFKIHEADRLLQAFYSESGERRRMEVTNEHVKKRVDELKATNPRIFG